MRALVPFGGNSYGARVVAQLQSRGMAGNCLRGNVFALALDQPRNTRTRGSEQSPPGLASGDLLPSDETGQSEGFSSGSRISWFKRNWLPLLLPFAPPSCLSSGIFGDGLASGAAGIFIGQRG